MKVEWVGMAASAASILLSGMFLFANPYSEAPPKPDTIIIVVVMLITPACLALASALARRMALMTVAFVWSLPYGLYLTFAALPSMWSLFGVVLLLYLVSVIRLAQTRRRRGPKY
ncbi:hypothetical protein FHS16_003386 [Paenibacillus endophyticus]|uniref:Uncharacterized protein n=1 Tax=Paenibacillus endophyticus TaxID=1294268 RepID=A0A7W5GAK6_9BACL|nr:hypothetical protein [Paenibacillus endophyticus]MBB3153324.1 hypothetical protein [Paenibacillus endophyticus]